MEVAVQGGGDHEEQVAGLFVHGAVVHALGKGHGREAGVRNSVALGVRHGDARLDGGAALGLAGQDGLLVGGFVRQVAAGGLQVDQGVDGARLVGGLTAQQNALGFQQVCDAHIVPSSLYSKS